MIGLQMHIRCLQKSLQIVMDDPTVESFTSMCNVKELLNLLYAS
jgi:hypothetical protein